MFLIAFKVAPEVVVNDRGLVKTLRKHRSLAVQSFSPRSAGTTNA